MLVFNIDILVAESNPTIKPARKQASCTIGFSSFEKKPMRSDTGRFRTGM